MNPPAIDAPPLRRTTEVIAELLPLEGRRVVDIGCGDGALVRFLAEHGAEAIGMEVRQAALGRAPDGGAHYLLGRAEALPLRSGTADAIVYLNSFHHVPGDCRAPALREARRVLAGGGRLLIIEPLAEGRYFELVRPVEDETAVRADAAALIDRAGEFGLARAQRLAYRNRVRFPGFDAFAERLARVDPGRVARLEAVRPALERDFARLAAREQGPEGELFAFDQPMRADLLQPAGG